MGKTFLNILMVLAGFSFSVHAVAVQPSAKPAPKLAPKSPPAKEVQPASGCCICDNIDHGGLPSKSIKGSAAECMAGTGGLLGTGQRCRFFSFASDANGASILPSQCK